MGLRDELDAYQTYLEAVRAHPDDEELAEDLAKAYAVMETAYLERMAAERDKPAGEAGGPLRRELQRPTFGPAEAVGWTTSDDAGVW